MSAAEKYGKKDQLEVEIGKRKDTISDSQYKLNVFLMTV